MASFGGGERLSRSVSFSDTGRASLHGPQPDSLSPLLSVYEQFSEPLQETGERAWDLESGELGPAQPRESKYLV